MNKKGYFFSAFVISGLFFCLAPVFVLSCVTPSVLSNESWTCKMCPDTVYSGNPNDYQNGKNGGICKYLFSLEGCCSADNISFSQQTQTSCYTCPNNPGINLCIDTTVTAQVSYDQVSCATGFCYYGQVQGDVAPPPCSPDCSCAINTCIGFTCLNGCGGSCAGTYSPSCACADNTCVGSTCSDGCGGACAGAKPLCSCAANTCKGNTCSDTCGGTCNGAKACSFPLTVIKQGNGLGTVASSDNKINCGGTCVYSFSSDSTISLTATALPGSVFTGWSGPWCAGTGPCVVNTNVEKYVKATFSSACVPTYGYCSTGANCCSGYCCSNTCSSGCCVVGNMCSDNSQCCSGRCCGGWCDNVCGNGLSCVQNSDCFSGYCLNNVCTALSNPTNIIAINAGLIDYQDASFGKTTDVISRTGYATQAFVDFKWDAVPGAAGYQISDYGSNYYLGAVYTNSIRFYSGFNGARRFPNSINTQATFKIKACAGGSCTSGIDAVSTDVPIENPDTVSCLNTTSEGFSVRVRSSEGNSAGVGGTTPLVLFRNKSAFSNLNFENSGIRVQIQNSDNTVRTTGYNASWVNTGVVSTYYINNINTINEFVPNDWLVFGLLPNTGYKVCVQARNRTGAIYEPGPSFNQWNCVTCATADIPAVGYLRIKAIADQIFDLRLVSPATAFSTLKGILKVARISDDTQAAADLVEPANPQASPVRVMTPYGIKAWRRK